MEDVCPILNMRVGTIIDCLQFYAAKNRARYTVATWYYSKEDGDIYLFL
jgi:hypothetical protein